MPCTCHCLSKSIVYKADVDSIDDRCIKKFIVMTSKEFKDRYRNQQKPFYNAKYENEMELSKYIWSLKRKQRQFRINWTVLKHVTAYRSGSGRCNLCNEEKLQIMLANKTSLLNRRSEVFAKCRHRDKFLAAGRFKRAREQFVWSSANSRSRNNITN